MPVAIETVIIVIVVVSFAVLSAVIFALYWLWRLLLEDRRCSRLDYPITRHEWQCQTSACTAEDGPQRALLPTRVRNPRIARRNEVIVDERSRRMVSKAATCSGCPPRPPHPPRVAVEVRPPEGSGLDDTEPPPPYEAIIS